MFVVSQSTASSRSPANASICFPLKWFPVSHAGPWWATRNSLYVSFNLERLLKVRMFSISHWQHEWAQCRFGVLSDIQCLNAVLILFCRSWASYSTCWRPIWCMRRISSLWQLWREEQVGLVFEFSLWTCPVHFVAYSDQNSHT